MTSSWFFLSTLNIIFLMLNDWLTFLHPNSSSSSSSYAHFPNVYDILPFLRLASLSRCGSGVTPCRYVFAMLQPDRLLYFLLEPITTCTIPYIATFPPAPANLLPVSDPWQWHQQAVPKLWQTTTNINCITTTNRNVLIYTAGRSVKTQTQKCG